MQQNVVLVCLDTVRKDYYDEFASRLAEAANVTYEQCRSASAWSTPSHASILTGELPNEHGVHTHNNDFTTLSQTNTIMGDLEDHTAIGVSANLFAGPQYGFDELFDRFTAVDPDVLFQDAWEPLNVSGHGVKRYVEYVKEARAKGKLSKYTANFLVYQLNQYLDDLPVKSLQDKGASAIISESMRQIRDTDGPFFLFTNFMDAHQPHYSFRGLDESLHDVPVTWSSADGFHDIKWEINRADGVAENTEFLEQFKQLYSASIEYLDRAVLEFVKRIRAETDGDTTFIITADHGENLGSAADEYMFEHTSSLSEGLLHVPMILIDAPISGSMHVTEYASHLALPELIRGLAHGQLPDVTRDRVASEVVGLAPGGADFTPDEQRYYDRLIRTVYEGERKYIWDSLGDRTVYELDADRPCWQEAADRPEGLPEWKSEFFPEPADEVKSRCAADEAAEEESVDEFAEARLRDLGYL